MLKIINPSNEKIIQELEQDSAETIQKKFLSAKAAHQNWKRVPLSEKLEMIRKFRGLLTEQKEHLATILTQEVGKPISQSRNELNGLTGRIDFFLENTQKVMTDEIVFTDSSLTEKISQEPLGVIANISAWNYPYFVGSNVFIPALLTGNTVLYKPSEYATLTGLEITRLLHQSGIPKDVFVPIVGSGAAGSELLKLPIQGLFFTGSYPTGLKIAEAVSKKMIRLQLELGGKDPAYICDDVDIARVAPAVADGAFYNTGQSCCSVERIYVHQKIYNEFLESFISTVKSFVTGDPRDEKTYLGAITRGAHLDYLEKQVADARQKGAQILCGGRRVPGAGYFFEPTVITQVNHSMDVMREETFGPVIGIQKVADDMEALELMNDTDYGLTSAIYTRDPQRAQQILERAESGTVYWNCCDRVSPRLPWSGRKHSGVGSTLSLSGILSFLQPKAWHWKN